METLEVLLNVGISKIGCIHMLRHFMKSNNYTLREIDISLNDLSFSILSSI